MLLIMVMIEAQSIPLTCVPKKNLLVQETNWTALMMAAANGHVKTVNALLAWGAELEARDKVASMMEN